MKSRPQSAYFERYKVEGNDILHHRTVLTHHIKHKYTNYRFNLIFSHLQLETIDVITNLNKFYTKVHLSQRL